MGNSVVRCGLLAAACAVWLIAGATNIWASSFTSAYSKLDIVLDCMWDSLDHLSEDEREQMLGNSAICTGYGQIPVHFSEFDIRQYVAFGDVGPDDRTPGGFGEFNRINDTIEWRLYDGEPFATILRWFIENTDPDTGATERALEGQVLVVSTVATPDNPVSCPIAYVDAMANRNANELARDAADRLAMDFRCGTDHPYFVGERGPLSGSPRDIDN